MVRGVLIAYLMLFTVAGPCACCCLATPLLAGDSAPPPAARCASAGKSCHTCGNCCSDEHRPAPPRPSPPCPSCPCGDPSLCCGAPVGKLDESFGGSWLRWLLDSLPGPVGLTDAEQAHAADLRTQDRYGVNYLRYWVDESAGKIFCLVEAPDAEAAVSVHREAHGLVADAIFPVAEGA